MKSKYQIGWIGIRASKTGRASKILKKEGWIRLDHASLNNRNGFDWIRAAQTFEAFNTTKWNDLAEAGLCGFAVWFCDAQWGQNSGITDFQWQNRKNIERDVLDSRENQPVIGTINALGQVESLKL